MDAAREHLWGQLLSEQNLVESNRLVALVAERDERVRSGHDCSLGQLLVQKRVLDVGRFQHLRSQVEGRGRACFNCRNVFLAPSPASPYVCQRCGGTTRLPPPTSGKFQAARPPGSDRYPGSGAYPSQGPNRSGRFGTGHASRPGSGPYASHAHRPHAVQQPQNPFVAPAGSFSGRAPGSGGYPPAPGGTGVYPGAPPGSGGYPSPGFTPVEPDGQRIGSTASAPDEFDISGDFDSGDLGVGKRFGRYEIVGELGRGGMGVVYKATQGAKTVAIKVLLAGEFASEKLKQRFKAESELSQRLDHPNIVPVFDVGEVDGLLYYAMGYVEGQELQDMIRAKSLPIRRGVEILVEVCHAAHHAHNHGVVHRDLKPSNVLVSTDGTPYIMDFGLAKNLEADKGMTKSGVAIGTPYYMPPEQARGSHREMDARSDVYALGAILYEIATRRVPFTAKTQNELLRKIIEEEPTPLRQIRAGVPADLETICLKCLYKEKDGRYESAQALAEDLERFLAGEPIKARRAPPWAAWMRKFKRNRTQSLVVMTAIVAVISAIGIIAVLHHNYKTKQLADAELREKEEKERKAREAEAERVRLQDEAKRRETEAQRQKAERAITSGQDAYASARAATSYPELLRALERAEAAFNEAVRLETKFLESKGPRASTAYRRGLVRRLRCSWEGALADFDVAANSKSHMARGRLAAALIQYRQMGDTDAAQTLFQGARVADGVSDLDEREESSAQEIAQVYLTYLNGDYRAARDKLSSLIEQVGLGSLSGEANGALAFFEREQGKMLEKDVHAERGLKAAERAVTANKFRYDFLIDRSVLRARSGQRKQASDDQRTARNLDVDGAWAELADALINSFTDGDDGRRKQAIESARAKARRRGPKAEQGVNRFVNRLEEATKVRRAADEKARTIDSDRTATMKFNGGGKTHVVKLGLRVKDPSRPVILTLQQATEDIDLYVAQNLNGAPPRSHTLSQHQSAGGGPNEILVLHKGGDPPLVAGDYTVYVVQPRTSRGKTSVKLSVRFLPPGSKVPFVWSRAPRVTLNSQAGAVEASRLLKLFTTGQFEQWYGPWLALEKREPGAMIIRLNLLTQPNIQVPEQYRSQEEFAKMVPQLELLARRLTRFKTNLTECLGVAEVLAGKVDEGLGRLRKALSEHPNKIQVRTRLINVLNHIERYDEAVKEGATVLELRGGDAPLARIAMGRTQLLLKDYPKAYEHFAAASRDPGLPISLGLSMVQELIMHRRFDDGLQLIQLLDARKPGLIDINLEVRRAFCYAGRGEKEKGQRALQTLAQNVPAGRPELARILEEGLRAIEDGSLMMARDKILLKPRDESPKAPPKKKKKRRR